MAKWYEAANEASFKKTADGYVFQSPNPWIFARPRYYLVNDAQKAEIAVHLRRWRLFTMMLVPIILLIVTSIAAFVILSPATFVPLFQSAFLKLGIGTFIFLMIVVMTVAVMPLGLAPHIYLMRALRPLLADAPRTDQRITMREQLPKIAASVSGWVLVAGLVGGLCIIAGVLLALVDAFVEGHLIRSLLIFSPALAIGGALIAYFVYLASLKAKLKRAAS